VLLGGGGGGVRVLGRTNKNLNLNCFVMLTSDIQCNT